MPVDTNPRKKIAKIIFKDKSNEKFVGSKMINGNEKKNPEIMVTDARAADVMWFSLKRILFEYA